MNDPSALRDAGNEQHTITVTNRETILLQGVLNVESFDDHQVILETELGMLSITGEELHIRELDLEDGRLFMEGLINGLTYAAVTGGGKRRSGGLFDRLFR